jgi:hypothetical protein
VPDWIIAAKRTISAVSRRAWGALVASIAALPPFLLRSAARDLEYGQRASSKSQPFSRPPSHSSPKQTSFGTTTLPHSLVAAANADRKALRAGLGPPPRERQGTHIGLP